MISLCITNYNRYEMLLESFARVLDDDRISEIVIVDDHSDMAIYDKVLAAVFSMPKVRLIRNAENLGMSLNKKKAIELAKNEWCCILDSDNVIDSSYFDTLLPAKNPKYTFTETSISTELSWRILDPTTIYCPSFAKPQFDFRKYAGWHILHGEAVIDDSMGNCLFNCCNYVVNRAEYLRVYENNPEMKGTDTIWFNYLWLKAGNSFYVVPGMEYMHRVHEGSGFLADCQYNMRRAKEIKQLIKAL